MSTNTLRRAGAFLVLAITLSSFPGQARADDIKQAFEMGRAAYYKGDLEMAHKLLSIVEAKHPNHQETRQLLINIRATLKQESSLKKRYEAVRLARLEFTDVSFEEALQGLRALSKKATNDQLLPNFIVKDATLNAKKVSLTLADVPLTQAIQYLADLADAKVTYDQHAVVFTSGPG